MLCMFIRITFLTNECLWQLRRRFDMWTNDASLYSLPFLLRTPQQPRALKTYPSPSPEEYGIELWGYSKPSNTTILQTFQSKMLRTISSAPWYVSNQTMHNDFDIPYVMEVVRINANKFKNRSPEHSNQLIGALFNPSVDRRLKPLWPEDLAQ